MTKTRTFSIVAAVSLALTLVVVAMQSSKPSVKTESAAVSASGIHQSQTADSAQLNSWEELDEEGFRSAYPGWESRHLKLRTKEDAASRVKFNFKTPKSSVVPVARGFYVAKQEPTDEVKIQYGDIVDGIHLTIHPSVATDEAVVRAAFASEIEANNPYVVGPIKPKLQNVNGHPGYGIEFRKYEKDQELYSSAVLSWYEDGVIYTLIGSKGDRPSSVAELMVIARTLQ